MAESKQDQNIVFSVDKIYIKDISYEAPGVPLAFSQAENAAAEIGVQLGLDHGTLNREQGIYEVVLDHTGDRHDPTRILLMLPAVSPSPSSR